MIFHTVLMRFDDPKDAQEAERLLRPLPEQIDVIKRLVVGRNLVPTERSYDLGLIIEFDTLDDLSIYLAHPAHEAAATFSRERRSAVASCDFTGSP